MNNDLISRSALKEEIVKLCKRINANNGITVPTLAFTRIIDNAPTVEEKSYAMGYQDGAEDGLDGIIPQGEWITIIGYANVRAFICDKCNGFNDLPTNYCPNCGASMKLGKKIKGGAENDK